MTKTLVSLAVCAAALAAVATAGGTATSSPCQARQLAFRLTPTDAGVGHRTTAIVVGTVAGMLIGGCTYCITDLINQCV